jgi:hypothetical protein
MLTPSWHQDWNRKHGTTIQLLSCRQNNVPASHPMPPNKIYQIRLHNRELLNIPHGCDKKYDMVRPWECIRIVRFQQETHLLRNMEFIVRSLLLASNFQSVVNSTSACLPSVCTSIRNVVTYNIHSNSNLPDHETSFHFSQSLLPPHFPRFSHLACLPGHFLGPGHGHQLSSLALISC